MAFRMPICSESGPRKSNTNFQITLAPTKLMAMGMNTMDLAKLPHQTRSASTATTRPKAVAVAGTTSNHRRLLRMVIKKFWSTNTQA